MYQGVWNSFICKLQIAVKEVTSSSTYILTPSLRAIALHLIQPHLQLSIKYKPFVDMEVMPSGIKIANRTGRILYDSAYIAGVDYSEDDDDEK